MLIFKCSMHDMQQYSVCIFRSFFQNIFYAWIIMQKILNQYKKVLCVTGQKTTNNTGLRISREKKHHIKRALKTLYCAL